MRRVKKERFFYLAAFLIAAAAAAVLAYPHISDWYVRYTAKTEISSYQSAISKEDADDLEEIREKAVYYNKRLAGENDLGTKAETETESFSEAEAEGNMEKCSEAEAETELSSLPSLADYDDMLAVTDAIAYLEIPKLDIYLPIYHGLDEKVLSRGIGHMPDSSLPVGGPSTHCVLSGHSGLPAAKLLTELDQMEEGDIFLIHVLDEVLAYEVDQIVVVLPDDFSQLQIEKDEDYVTLLTCTPYGINSHRLLVRGSRTEYAPVQMSLTAPEPETGDQTEESGQMISAEVLLIGGALAAGVMMAAVILLILFWPGRKENDEEDSEQKRA